MGRDKAALELCGETLLLRAIAKLRRLDLSVRVAGLRTPVPTLDVPVIPDRFVDCGPLGGVETALRESVADFVLALAVDVPLIEPAFLWLLLTRASRTRALATIPRVTGAPQPLCAVYHRALHAPVAIALAAGDFKIMRVIESAAHALGGSAALDLFDAETAWTAAGVSEPALPLALQFLNCNAPGDISSAATLVRANLGKHEHV